MKRPGIQQSAPTTTLQHKSVSQVKAYSKEKINEVASKLVATFSEEQPVELIAQIMLMKFFDFQSYSPISLHFGLVAEKSFFRWAEREK